MQKLTINLLNLVCIFDKFVFSIHSITSTTLSNDICISYPFLFAGSQSSTRCPSKRERERVTVYM